MQISDSLFQLENLMLEKSETIHKRLRNMPKGSIQIVNDKGHVRVNQVVWSKGEVKRAGIKRNPEKLRLLAAKSFYKEYVRRLDYNIDVLRCASKRLLPMDDDSIIRKMPANFELLPEEYREKWIPSQMHPVFGNAVKVEEAKLYIPEEEQGAWASRPYRANDFHRQPLSYRTYEGFRMRSKSEMTIFEMYKKMRIPVHYDEILLFNGIMKSPDFHAMRYDGKVIIQEHCGLVNNREYMKAHYEKIELYKSCGFVPWDNLIVTYDLPNGGIDLGLVEAQITSMFR